MIWLALGFSRPDRQLDRLDWWNPKRCAITPSDPCLRFAASRSSAIVISNPLDFFGYHQNNPLVGLAFTKKFW
ncbi:hypothetical protein [Burkholderia ambifaria]|uniref:hypothetical protein n=1 Tax=Burkholderia ambifaria TaxID=152480 RepID=UPI00158E0703|nr:hypothetical protein [Burkholderia ambifaria]